MDEKRRGIDVILPIYNAYDDLQLCIDSIKRHVDFTVDRVILIDDCSPDERIRPFIDELSTHNGFVAIYNETNMGFSGSVNRGICYSGRDVILLNSDTIVTKGWIDKIICCADSDVSIGTVTPLSNCATICSIPVFCQDNPVPKGYTVDQYAEIVERCSLRCYPEISVAVGFCMFIKRQLIDQIGLFDAETYQRGYGEENDFCWLANELGYIHVLCDDTFVYHKSTVSFPTEEKKKLMEAHARILQERYPQLMHANDVFCATDKNWKLRKNIELYAQADPRKKSILYVLHLDFHENCKERVGGTQFHVQDLTRELRTKYNIYVAARDGMYLRLTLYTEQGRAESKFLIGDEKPYFAFHDRKLQELFSGILSAFCIDMVHVHHVHGLSLDIFNEAAKQKIPLVATLHDYYAVCPTIAMMDREGNECCGKENTEACRACLWKNCAISPKSEDYIRIWRREHHKALCLCDRIFVPSESVRERVSHYYPDLGDKITCVEHGLRPIVATTVSLQELRDTQSLRCHFESLPNPEKSVYTLSGWAYLEDTDSKNNSIYIYVTDNANKTVSLKAESVLRADVAAGNENYLYSGFSVELPMKTLRAGMLKVRVVIKSGEQRWSDGAPLALTNPAHEQTAFNVAFIGGMSPAKGSQIACQLIRHSPSNIGWYVIGGIGDRELELLQQRNLTKLGWYERSELANILELLRIDLVCILSRCPETFCYTLSESWMCGVPVLGINLGAVGERIKRTGCGWVVSLDASYTEILDLIQNLNRSGEEYRHVKERAENLRIRTTEEMAADYSCFYESQMKDSKPARIPADKEKKELLLDGYLQADGSLAKQGQGYHEIATQLETVTVQLQAIQSSLAYKFGVFLSQLKIPFKRQIKTVLLKIYRKLKAK